MYLEYRNRCLDVSRILKWIFINIINIIYLKFKMAYHVCDCVPVVPSQLIMAVFDESARSSRRNCHS